MTKTYTLTVTESQLGTIQTACEVLARLGMGQFRDALEHLPLKPDYELWHIHQLEIGSILQRHMKDCIDGWRSNFSINSDKVDEQARTAWDLYQVVRHRLSWDRAVAEGKVASLDAPRNWPEMLGVCYDEPMKVGNEPLATIYQIGIDFAKNEN